MKPETALVLTSAVAIGGTFAKHPKDVSRAIKVTVGVTAYGFGLLVMAEAQPDLAGKFAILVLVTALFFYATPLVAFIQSTFLAGGKK